MLERLELKNLAVIEEAELDFAPGLNVLTGETGAGKSLLIDGLALLLGAKAEPHLIRPGAEAALVTAWIDGVPYSRRIGSRSTPRIAGEVVTLAELKEAVEKRLSLYAQHAAVALLRPATQRRLLDSLVPKEVRERYQSAFRRYQELFEEAKRLKEAEREREHRLDLLRFQVEEIERTNPTPEEEERLFALRERLKHRETIRARLAEAAEALLGEGDASGSVGRAAEALAQAARHDPELGPLALELENLEAALGALAREVEERLLALEEEPERLDEVEARLFELERLKRKYGDSVAEILAYKERAEKELLELEGLSLRLDEVEKELSAAEKELYEAAQALSEERRRAAKFLSERVERELRALALPEARFAVELVPKKAPGPGGAEEVRFLFSANPGLSPAPLEKVASGGELSRTLLAILLSTEGEAETVVLDEIDAGVGGEAARALADRLARLAERHQVIVVTHLPQIAARAKKHFRVKKEKGRAEVEEVKGKERVLELARMLSGGYEPEAIEHARALLES